MDRFHIRLANDQLTFSAAHFLCLKGSQPGADACEPLHGHDYRVAVEIEGPLDKNQFAADFVAVQAMLAAILAELDHRVLLPTLDPKLSIAADDREVRATWADRRWVFPRADCCLLEIPATTSELLAQWIGQRLLGLLAQAGASPDRVRIVVSEGRGWSAAWEGGGEGVTG